MPRDELGKPVALGARLGRGGEGDVHAVDGQPTLVAKVLAPDKRAGKPAKLRAMLANPPPGAHGLVEGLPVLTWPRGLLLEGTDVVGYTMARVQPADFVAWQQITSPGRRASLGGAALTFDRQVKLGLRLAHVVATLHKLGYAVGDLNDRNVLVSRRLTPLLMDTDSFQVPDGRRSHPCTVGDALYWPPELLDVDLARHPVDRRASDEYALAVLLFQLFLGGLRPYQSRGSLVDGLVTLQDKTRAGHYAWAHPRSGVLEPPAGAPDYRALPKPLRDAFERAFVDGHRKPRKRPSADDWVGVLRQVHDSGVSPTIVLQAVAAKPRPPVARVPAVRKQAPIARRGPRPKGPPQLVLAPTKPPSPPMVAKAPMRRRPPSRPSVKSVVSAPKPKARAGGRKARPAKAKRRRRPVRAKWPTKARWMAALTTALVAAWWVMS